MIAITHSCFMSEIEISKTKVSKVVTIGKAQKNSKFPRGYIICTTKIKVVRIK